jgi:hypothetical protein
MDDATLPAASGTGSDDLQAIVDDLALRIGRSVAVDDAELRLLAHSAHVGDEDEARLQSLLLRRVSDERFAWAREVGILSATEPFLTPSAEELGIRKRFIVPLRADRELLAVVWIIDDGSLGQASIDMVLEASARMRAILVRRSMAAEDARRRESGLVLALLGADSTMAQAAASEFRDRGTFPRADRFFVMDIGLTAAVVSAEPILAVRAAERAIAHRVDGIASTAVPADSTVVTTSVIGGMPDAVSTVIVVGTARSWTDDERTELAEAVRRELRVLDARTATGTVIGIGGTVDAIEIIRDSFVQARAAVRVARVDDRAIGLWGGHGVDDLLAGLLPSGLNSALVPPAVAALVDSQPAEVIEAVQVFLDEAGNAARTGTRLHLHRTTVYYRLSRFQETTGLDLEDGRTRFLLQLWFAAVRFSS